MHVLNSFTEGNDRKFHKKSLISMCGSQVLCGHLWWKTASEAISECLIYHGGNMRRACPLSDACYARTGWAHAVPTYIIYSSGLRYCPALNVHGLKVKLTPFLHYHYACLVLLC